MERELQERERAVLNLLVAADQQGADLVRESLPHVRVVGACGCGCESFDLRDMRYPTPEDPGIEDWSSVVSEDGLTSIVLWIDAEGRPNSVDILTPNQGRLPDPNTLRLVARPDRA